MFGCRGLFGEELGNCTEKKEEGGGKLNRPWQSKPAVSLRGQGDDIVPFKKSGWFGGFSCEFPGTRTEE